MRVPDFSSKRHSRLRLATMRRQPRYVRLGASRRIERAAAVCVLTALPAAGPSRQRQSAAEGIADARLIGPLVVLVVRQIV